MEIHRTRWRTKYHTSDEVGSCVLRYNALGLLLRLACDLPTMEDVGDVVYSVQ